MSNEAFKAGFAALMKRAKGQADLVARKVAMDLMASLVLKSPVDTGRFRGNWQCGIGSVDLTIDSTADPVETGNSSQARTEGVLGTWKPGQAIYLTNSLPYARRLEYGWSKQAPGGMVRLTVIEYGQYLRQAVEATK